MQLLANMVIRNESENYLTQVLDRLKGQVDKIIITDDCSDDNSAEIAESYGAIVQVMAEPIFSTNEGKLRQISWEHLEKYVDDPENTWVLAIDADEELYVTGPSLEQLVNHPNFDVYNIQFYHMWNEKQYRIDKAWAPHGSTRLFRYVRGGRFKDRALACGSEPTYVSDKMNQGRFYGPSGLKMKHLSYIRDEDKKKKFERYSAIDGGNFHAGNHIQSIVDPEDIFLLADWLWE